MGETDVSIIAAFVGGLFSFFSPCVVPLVPVYLGYLTGTMVNNMRDTRRITILLHALLFVLGLSFVFVLLGTAAGMVGQLLYPALPYIVRIGGLFLIVFGLHLTGVISVPFLNLERRFEVDPSRQRQNYWTSFLVGVIFAAGWTPCVGPVLAAILLLAAQSQTAGRGALLLVTYALGLGIPFLVVAALVDLAIPVMRKITRYLRIISIISGMLLILIGLLFLTGFYDIVFQTINSLFA